MRGCFNNAESHSVGFVVRWVGEHCHRLVSPVHRYCVHMLATRHRDVETLADDRALELGTPVLERAAWAGAALRPAAAWLLAAAAPPLYSRPLKPPSQPHPGENSTYISLLVMLPWYLAS